MARVCRLLGVLTPSAEPLAQSMSDLVDPFLQLSREHRDGWGLACWAGDRISVDKEPLPAYESELFAAAVAAATTDAALLHLRLASPGLPLCQDNTHPFVAGRLAFAHNGSIQPVSALDDLLAETPSDYEVCGTTDSERYFALLLQALRDREPATAIVATAARIRAATQIVALNCLLLTEDALFAYTEHDPMSEPARRRGPDFFPMRYTVTDERVVVASSGFAQPEPLWRPLHEGDVLEVRRGTLEVRVHQV